MRNPRPRQTLKEVENTVRAMAFLIKLMNKDSSNYDRILKKYTHLKNRLEQLKQEEVNKNYGK